MAEVKVGILIEAVDQATAEMNKVGSSANAMAGAVEQSSSRIETANTKSAMSLKEFGSSISALTTSAMSLIFMFNNLERATYAANKAQNAYEDRVRGVSKAQDDLNKAIAKYGPDSAEAAAAAVDLKAKQDDLTLAIERLQLTQQNLNQAQLQTAFMVIPALITAITNIQPAIAALNAGLLFLAANPIYLVLGGLIIIVAALITNFGGFRDAVLGAFTAIYNALKPIIDPIISWIKGLWDTIMGVINAIKSFLDWLGKLGGAETPTTPTVPTTPGLPTGVPGLQLGGIVREAGLAFLHRHELVIPGARAEPLASAGVTINGPLLVIQGSADEATARLATRLIMRDLSVRIPGWKR